jgi:hypothetical protein
MRTCRTAGRVGVCGGLVAVALLLTGFLSRPSEAQDKPAPELPSLPQTPAETRPVPPTVAPPATPPAQAVPAPKSFEQLMAALADIRAKKTDLDRQEKETIAALRQQFHEQHQALAEKAGKLRELGIEVFEAAPAVPSPTELPTPTAPAPRLAPDPAPDTPKGLR